jgi:hypothetical protein
LPIFNCQLPIGANKATTFSDTVVAFLVTPFLPLKKPQLAAEIGN